MPEYTRLESPMEIRAAGDNILYGTAKCIFLVTEQGTDDTLRQVKMLVVLVSELKRICFPTSTAAEKGIKHLSQGTDRPSTLDHLVFS